jgi:hypothetical protein
MAQADARRLFDESHALAVSSYPAGTKFKLQRDAGDNASFYIIDTIDLEQVAAPLSQPAGCTSITQYGAIAGEGIDDADAIQRAVTDDQNGVISCVWIPAGQWRQEKKILTDDPLNRGQYKQVGISNVTIRGRRQVVLAAVLPDRTAERRWHQTPARRQLRLGHRQEHPDLRHRHLRLRLDPWW